MNIRWARTGSPILAMFAACCATLPDTSDYTVATVAVRQAAAAAGNLVSTDIAAAADSVEDDTAKESIRESAQSFGAAWSATLKSLDGAVAYAGSIETVTHAGNEGAKGAKAVADGVSNLAGTLGIVIGPAGGAISQAGAFIYGEVAKIRAARSLSVSLAIAGPSIIRMQDVISEQVAAARRTYLFSIAAQTRALRKDSGLGFYPLHDRELETEEKAKVAELVDAVLDPVRSARIAPLKARIALIHQTRAGLADGLKRYETQAAELVQRRKAGLAVFAATDGALAAWTAAHIKLAAAVQQRQPVTVTSVITATEDLRALTEKWRAL